MKNDCVPFLKLGFLFRVHFRSSRLAPFLSSTDVLSQQKTVPCEWLLCLFKSVSAFVLRFKSMRHFFFFYPTFFTEYITPLHIVFLFEYSIYFFIRFRLLSHPKSTRQWCHGSCAGGFSFTLALGRHIPAV